MAISENSSGSTRVSLRTFEQGDTPTQELPELSVVIPTYRQASVIGSQVKDVLATLDRLDCEYEVLVVVDGDIDNSAATLETIEHERLRIAVLEENAGKGNAVRRGLLAVAGRCRAFLDGGGDIPPQCLIDAYQHYVASNADIVVGSKLHPDSIVEYPLVRRIYSWGYRLVTRVLFGLAVRDTQVGLKLYRSSMVEQVFPHVRTAGFAFDIEALALARRLGFRQISEAPVIVRDQYPSSIRVTTIAAMFLETLMVWWRLQRFGPDKHGSYRPNFD